MEVEALSLVPEEALAVADHGVGDGGGVRRHQHVHQDYAEGEQGAPAPGHGRVDGVLEGGGALPRHLRPHEGPAQVEAHDGHPGEHAHREEVAAVAEDLADNVRKGVGEVVDNENVGGEEEDSGDVAEHDLAVEVVELGHGDVDDEGDEEEDAGDAAADGVDKAEDTAVFLDTVSGNFIIL